MDEALQQAVRWREVGRKVAVATVVATRRSAPRPVGSKLFVSESGELAGSVSGGCVESDVVLAAQEVLAGGPPRLLTYGITDEMAFGIGLPCGGEIDVFVEELTEAEQPEVTLTVVAGEGVGERLHDPELERGGAPAGSQPRHRAGGPHGARGRPGAAAAALRLRRGRHGGGSLSRGEAPRLADGGRRRARGASPPPSESRAPTSSSSSGPRKRWRRSQPDLGTAVVVLTHDDKFDLPMIRGALAGDAFYVGWIGSRRNQERRRGLLREEGMTDDELARISGPSGLDIGAGTPSETAVSILGEILAVRAGRDGGRLRDAKTRIHASL